MEKKESKKNENDLNEALTRVLNILEMEHREDLINSEIFNQLLAAFSIDLESQIIPTGIAPDYVGVHLGPTYDDYDFKQLIKSFKNNQVLDPFYTLKILKDAKEKLEKLPNIHECLIEDPLESGCIVIGDLHGNFNDLNHIISKYGVPGADFKYIFNGDYVDRGEKQIEVLLTILYAFLIRPDRVFINRGNHEDIQMNVRPWSKINFLNHLRNINGKYWNTIFNTAEDLFSYMPLATILNNRITDKKYFVVHGGIADRIDLEFVQVKLDRTKFKQIHRENIKNEHEAYETKLVCDFLWSDPIRSENGKTKTGCFFNSNRNLGSFFGEDVTKDFCERHGFNCIIRSHQVRAKGYSEDHHKCITVFSASHYCDGHNYGAVLKFTPDGHKPKPHRYKTKTGDISDDTFLKTQNLMKRFKILIQKNESEFQKRFEKYDKENTGWIKSTQWAQVLSNFFNEEISVEQLSVLKSFLCECNLDKDLVNYRTMFKQKIGDEKRGKFFDKNTKEVIENLFYLIDRNNDKRISINDAKEALKIVNERLGGTNLFHNAHEFIKLMDKNQDNIIDLDDFKKTFLQDQEVIQSTNEL